MKNNTIRNLILNDNVALSTKMSKLVFILTIFIVAVQPSWSIITFYDDEAAFTAAVAGQTLQTENFEGISTLPANQFHLLPNPHTSGDLKISTTSGSPLIIVKKDYFYDPDFPTAGDGFGNQIYSGQSTDGDESGPFDSDVMATVTDLIKFETTNSGKAFTAFGGHFGDWDNSTTDKLRISAFQPGDPNAVFLTDPFLDFDPLTRGTTPSFYGFVATGGMLIDMIRLDLEGPLGGVSPAFDNLRYSTATINTGGGTPVPEPSTWALLGLGVISMIAYRRRK